jgi:hypothetical protein
MDAFGTDEVTFVTLLKFNWFLVICFPTNPSHWTDVRYLAPWCVFPAGCQWMVLRFFNSALQEITQMCYYLSLEYDSLKRFDLASCCFGTVLRNLTAYQTMRLRWGASQVPTKTRGTGLPLIHSGGSNISLDLSSPPRSFVFYPDYEPPWVDI